MAYTTVVEEDHNPIESGGINGGFHKRKSREDHLSVGVETDSIDQMLTAIEKMGGTVVRQHTRSASGVIYMADFADPEGNVMALWEKPKR